MAKTLKSKQARKSKIEDVFPFERENYIILGVGLVCILLGYIALSAKSVEGFMPLIAAPILLVLGYCVIIPAGIIFRKKHRKAVQAADDKAPAS